MKKEDFKPIKNKIYFPCLFLVSMVVNNGSGQIASGHPISINRQLSSRVQLLKNKNWGDLSFNTEIAILLNKSENLNTRRLVLELLSSKKQYFNQDQMWQFLFLVKEIVRDSTGLNWTHKLGKSNVLFKLIPKPHFSSFVFIKIGLSWVKTILMWSKYAF